MRFGTSLLHIGVAFLGALRGVFFVRLGEEEAGYGETQAADDGRGQRLSQDEDGCGGGEGGHQIDVGGGYGRSQLLHGNAPGDEARSGCHQSQEEEVRHNVRLKAHLRSGRCATEQERGWHDEDEAPEKRPLGGCDGLIAQLRDSLHQERIHRPDERRQERQSITQKVFCSESERPCPSCAGSHHDESCHGERKTCEETHRERRAIPRKRREDGREQRRCSDDDAHRCGRGVHERHVLKKVIRRDARGARSDEEELVGALLHLERMRPQRTERQEAQREPDQQDPERRHDTQEHLGGDERHPPDEHREERDEVRHHASFPFEATIFR